MLRAEMLTRDSIIVRFDYTPEMMVRLQKFAGGKFIGSGEGGPGFKFILDMTTCKRLREAFGDEVLFHDNIMEWGREKEAERKRLADLSSAESAELSDLSIVAEKLPKMFEMLRPYQKAGIRFIAESKNPLVADEPGLGKTWEVIASIFQSKLDDGPNLIVCPKISIENVWLYELARFQDHPVFVAPEGRKQRDILMEEVEFALDVGQPFWLVVNPAMLTYRRSKEGNGVYDARTDSYFDSQFPFISKTNWNCIVVDEAHMSGITNASSQTARAISTIKAKKRIATTGTPAGGKAQRLWGLLHWLEPKEFTSRARWSDQWLVKSNFVDQRGVTHSDYKGFNSEHEAKFYQAHSQYILRRKKEEVYKEMPPKQYMTVTVDMSVKQAAQYKLMKQEADAKIGEAEDSGRLNVSHVLATYSWLKQFSNAYCDIIEREKVWSDEIDGWVQKYKAIPTEDCPKLEALMQILEELDVPNGEEQVVVFTQFRHMADMVTDFLTKKGIPTDKITGSVSSREKRNQITTDFQAKAGTKVMVMTTKAGGVSINLDMANTVVFLDETWDPDDQTQAEDRCHRVSRVHHVTVYRIKTKGTIEDRISQVLNDKVKINEVLLDMYRGDHG